MPDDKKTPAIEVEAQGLVTLTIQYGGNDYVFPSSLDEADGSVLEALEDGKLSKVVTRLLDAKSLERFQATKPKVKDYRELFAAYADAIGLKSAGE